ncbi:UcrQ family protein [Saprolegnia diclina VS20]|uniref:Cytochrome b-c1 complex subunit 8 n=1 Tax=Saprolegnia diclina (strain VS20) TaxID=1156394 RepID=T0QJF0_SAPDV|nr:UcrQ family protein [Saprolegnia diclina VS20]EQC38159.1 UcrQ family protein [Saprolegnia diclina VS20]|eukprot:XP_008608486.1 UcrQ family protein [Saprolegnia diclina VS20]
MSRPQAALTTWWKKYAPETGRVVRTLSPYEQRPVDYLIKSAPQKALRKVQENALVLVPSFFLLWGTVAWAKGENDRYHRTHWA